MMVSRGFVRDVYVEDGRSAVFVRDQVIVLSEIATAILEATPATGSVSLAAITDAVVDIYGAPEPPLTSAGATQDQVLELVAHQVLRLDTADAPEAFTPDSVEALRSALGHLVSQSAALWELPDGVTGPQLMSAAERHRVVPTLAAGAHLLALPVETKARLVATATQESATVAVLSTELVEVINALAHTGVRVLAFKGLALAVQAHGDVSARGTGDHDLLVAPEDIDQACERLMALGWMPTATSPHLGDGWVWRYFVQTGYELSLVRGTSMIDLHWHAGPVRHSSPSFQELWARHFLVSINDHAIPTLSAYDALAHSASHSAKDHWRWQRGLLDVWLLMSDIETWRDADRPLRRDQLMSVGLAALMFGTPPNAPAIVYDAQRLATTTIDAARLSQVGPPHADVAKHVPGMGLFQAVDSLRRAEGSSRDYGRYLVTSLLPPAYATRYSERSAFVAVPRVLGRRTKEVLTLWRQAARGALR